MIKADNLPFDTGIQSVNPQDNTPRGLKRSRSPEPYGDAHHGQDSDGMLIE